MKLYYVINFEGKRPIMVKECVLQKSAYKS